MNNFRFSFEKSYSILMFFILFFPSLPLNATEHITDEVYDLTLAELLNMEVMVATRTMQKTSEAPGIISVVTENEIKNMGARNLLDVIKTIPGLDLSHNLSASRYAMAVRGNVSNSSNKIKLLYNGHAFLENETTFYRHGIMERLPIDNIRRIK